MNIGVYLSSQDPETGGGFTIQADIISALLKCVEDTPHKLVVFSWERDTLPMEIATTEKVKHVKLSMSAADWGKQKFNTFRRSLKSLFSGRAMHEWHRTQETDRRLVSVIEENSVQFFFLLSAGFLTLEVPYSVVVWDLQHRLQPYFPEVSRAGIWKDREILYSDVLRRASFVIAGNDAGRREIETFFQVPAQRIKVLRHPTPAFALNDPPGDMTVLERCAIHSPFFFYPAQFWAHKNHVGILHALKRLKDEFSLTPLMIFSGADQGNIEHVRRTVEELGLSSQVKIIGFVTRPELVALYKSATALVYCTLFGPENLPPLEAFALGCPVIASKVAGAEEQYADYAVLVDPHDERELTVAMKLLLEDSELRQRLKEKALARANEWTAKQFAEGLFDIADSFEAIRRCWP